VLSVTLGWTYCNRQKRVLLHVELLVIQQIQYASNEPGVIDRLCEIIVFWL